MINPPSSVPPGPRLIGLVGGTGWLSTLEYYRLINQGINRALGGHEAARCVLYSLNFGDIMRIKGLDPEQTAVRELVVDAARTVADAGAECVVICANTLHWFAEGQAVSSGVYFCNLTTDSENLTRKMLPMRKGDGRPAVEPVHRTASITATSAERPFLR